MELRQLNTFRGIGLNCSSIVPEKGVNLFGRFCRHFTDNSYRITYF